MSRQSLIRRTWPESNLRKRLVRNTDEASYTGQWKGIGRAWLESLGDSLRNFSFFQEMTASLTVAAVALPLNLALAVACGLPPVTGLMAGAVGGLLASLFGGAPLQVTGPAAALNFMVMGLVAGYGAGGAAAAALLVGAGELLLCLFFAGRLAKYVPESVLAGFMSGVGLKLLDQQIPILLGLEHDVVDLLRTANNPVWLHEVSWFAFLSGLFVAFLVTAMRGYKRVPAALIGITLTALLSAFLGWNLARVGPVSGTIPMPGLPDFSAAQWTQLALRCLPLAALAAVESLLSAQAVDRMRGSEVRPHNPNLELLGQSIANLGAGFMMGMPVTGVIVRSSVNVQAGAKTRFAAAGHAGLILLAVLYLSQGISIVPLAALAGLLCTVGFRLVEISTFGHLLRDNRIGALAFALAAAGTVSGKLVEGLVSGLALEGVAALIRRRGSKKIVIPVVKKATANASIRAELPREAGLARRPEAFVPGERGEDWFTHITERPYVPASAFVHPRSSVVGRVILGDKVHVAAETSLRADEGTPFFVGPSSNIQDGVVIHALKNKWVRVGEEDWAVYVGRNVSIAHQALVHGPCYIGDHSFVGFRAVVHDSVVGSGCYVGIGAVVVGVEVPPNRYVPHGTIVDSAEKAQALPPASEAHKHFNEDVVDVNRGLTEAYHKMRRLNL